jgi:DNA polymerase elongation subunit (family B)
MVKDYGELENMIRKEEVPRILVIDIETSPIIAYTWGPKWETNLIEVVQQGKIICYSAKWLNGNQVTKALPDYKGYRNGKVDDSRIIQDIHKLLDASDIVVTQNGVDFDTKYINARFVEHGLPPPSPYKNVDTKREAKKYLRMPSYSLDDMGKFFGLGEKLPHEGWTLWKKCMAGDPKAWNKMKQYNAQDVKLTEKVYLKLRPYMKTHPNVITYNSTTKAEIKEMSTGDCPKCGSEHTQARGYAVNATTTYGRAQCQDCGGWYRYGKALRKNINPGVNQ